MTEQHTPGPWTSDAGKWQDGANVHDSRGYEVASLRYIARHKNALRSGRRGKHIERPEAEIYANSKLMAAAPVLRSACYAALVEIERLDKLLSDTPHARDKATVKKILTAIKKAEGK